MPETYRTSVAGGSAVDNTPVAFAVTPVAGDLWIVLAIETGAGAFATPTLTDNNGGGTYTLIDAATIAGVGYVTAWVRTTLILNTTSTTITYTSASTPPETAIEFVVVPVSGAGVAGITAIRQFAHNNGAAGVATVTFGAAPLTANMLIAAIGNTTNPLALTAPASFTARQQVGNAQPVGLEVATVNNGVTATAITWATNPVTAWAGIAIELDGLAFGAGYQDLTSRGFTAVPPSVPSGPYKRQQMVWPPAARKSGTMAVIKATVSVAKNVSVLMRGEGSDRGIPGISAFTIALRKNGGAYATITPVVVDKGGGTYEIALTAVHLDTLGIANLRVTATAQIGIEGSVINDDVAIDVDVAPAGAADLTTVVAGVADVQSRIPLALQVSGGVGMMRSYVDDIDGTSITAIQSGLATALATTDIQSRLPAALVVSFGVGMMRSSAELAGAGAITQLQNGMATAADVAAVAAAVAAIPADFTAGDRTKLERLDTDFTTARAGYLDNLDIGEAVAGASQVDTTYDLVRKIAGLQHLNSKLDKFTYNGAKGMLTCRLRSWDDAAGLAAAVAIDPADDAEGETMRFVVTATFNANGTLKSYALAQDLP